MEIAKKRKYASTEADDARRKYIAAKAALVDAKEAYVRHGLSVGGDKYCEDIVDDVYPDSKNLDFNGSDIDSYDIDDMKEYMLSEFGRRIEGTEENILILVWLYTNGMGLGLD